MKNTETQQTAIDTFIVRLRHLGYLGVDDSPRVRQAIKQAKEIEKERIREAMCMQVKKYTTAYLDEDGNPQLSYDIDDSFNAFYNETYGGNK